MFYVKSAIGHLLLLDRQIQELQDYSNTNALHTANILQDERLRLTTDNLSYRDADKIVAVFRAEELRQASLRDAQEIIDSWVHTTRNVGEEGETIEFQKDPSTTSEKVRRCGAQHCVCCGQ
jgi:CO dehydrogenase/acetyl-CoA synthase alpha subunit